MRVSGISLLSGQKCAVLSRRGPLQDQRFGDARIGPAQAWRMEIPYCERRRLPLFTLCADRQNIFSPPELICE